jgi:hypothetical protein
MKICFFVQSAQPGRTRSHWPLHLFHFTGYVFFEAAGTTLCPFSAIQWATDVLGRPASGVDVHWFREPGVSHGYLLPYEVLPGNDADRAAADAVY